MTTRENRHLDDEVQLTTTGWTPRAALLLALVVALVTGAATVRSWVRHGLPRLVPDTRRSAPR